MISLIPGSIVDESDLFIVDVQALRLSIDPPLVLNLRHRQSHREDAIASLKLHFNGLLVTDVSLIVFAHEEDPAAL